MLGTKSDIWRQAIFGLSGPPAWLPLGSGGVTPLLFADFANSNYWYNGLIYPSYAAWMTAIGGVFSRASSATYFDVTGTLQSASSNVARFTFDPVSHAALGLRLTGARTNLCLWNRDLTNAAWVASNVTPLKDQAGIDGAANAASSITATAGNGTILQSITSGSASRMQSAYVKRLTGSGTINMTMDGGTTWTVITVTASYAKVTVPNATLANPQVGFRLVTNGDAIAVDFAQNEVGAFAGDPIPTTSASATQGADSLVIGPTGGVPVTGWNASAGTLFTKGTSALGVAIGNQRYAIFQDASGTNEWGVARASADRTAHWSSSVVDVATGVINDNTAFKLVAAGAANDVAVSLNGAAPATSGAQSPPGSVDRLSLGNRAAGDRSLEGYLSQVAYWPSRLSNADLQRLST